MSPAFLCFWVVGMEKRIRRHFLNRVFLIKDAHRSRLLRQICLPQKANLYEMCGLISSDIFHLAEYQETQCGQKLRVSGVCEKPLYFRVNFHQHQKQHIGEKPLRSDVRRALVVSSCKFYVSMKPFTLGNIGKDFLGNSGFLHQQATHTWQKSHSETECEAPFLRGKNLYNWGDYTKTFSGKHAVVQHQRVLTRERCYVFTECGKSFSKTPISLDIRAFTLEKGLMSAVNVGKPLSKDHISFSTREFTLEKGLMSVKMWEIF